MKAVGAQPELLSERACASWASRCVLSPARGCKLNFHETKTLWGSQDRFSGRACAFWASRCALCTRGCRLKFARAVGQSGLLLGNCMCVMGLTVRAGHCPWVLAYALHESRNCGAVRIVLREGMRLTVSAVPCGVVLFHEIMSCGGDQDCFCGRGMRILGLTVSAGHCRWVRAQAVHWAEMCAAGHLGPHGERCAVPLGAGIGAAQVQKLRAPKNGFMSLSCERALHLVLQ